MAGLEITVFRIDEAKGVLDRILDKNRPNHVGSAAGHPDLDPLVLSFPAFFVLEGLAALVQDGAHPEIKVVVEPPGSLIPNRNITIHAVPGARETESNGLSDVNPAAG